VASNTQRLYKAPCPNCGAQVEFKSAGSAVAVCGFCSSTLVREGEALRKIGEQSDLFEDYSPLQIGTSGKHSSITFTIIGRLQYRYGSDDGGTWNEWYVLFDNATNGWLSEDNGKYVLSFDVADIGRSPPLDGLNAGVTLSLHNTFFTVASVVQATLIAAQGELPASSAKTLATKQAFTIVDLRSAQGEVATLDYSQTPPNLSIGRSADLNELKLQNLRTDTEGAAEKTLNNSRTFNCPSCGASVQAKLSGTQSMTCASCASVIDLSRGIGGDIEFYRQSAHLDPAIPLGTLGKLKGTDWQVVGFQQRRGFDGEDSFYWQEYLLYNRLKGFTFLVDTTEGWSLVSPLTGVPQFKNPGSDGATALINQRLYRETARYQAQTEYVAGEFYWQVKSGQRTSNIDFEAGPVLASREETITATSSEVTWSAGDRVEAREVSAAFKLDALHEAVHSPDTAPTSGALSSTMLIVLFIVMLILVFFMVSRCSSDNEDNYNGGYSRGGYYGGTSGGSYGGASSGGGHK
jgi:endogenous inhibitor of DNA gyrase (YacG/DUF329 family)